MALHFLSILAAASLRAEDLNVGGRVELPDGQPAKGARVSAYNAETTCGAEGGFKLKLDSGWIPPSLTVVSADGKAGASLPMPKANKDDLQIRLRPCVELAVRAVDPDGKPFPELAFSVWGQATGTSDARQTDAKGEDRVAGLIDGQTYSLSWDCTIAGETMLNRGSKRVKAGRDTSVVIQLERFAAPSGSIAVSKSTHCKSISSFCLNAAGDFLLCDPQDRRIRVIAPDDRLVKDWKLDFGPEVAAACPDGSVIAAGSGKIARLDAEGRPALSSALPGGAKSASAVGAMGNDVFVSVRARTGYSIYRLDADFKNPAVIVKGLRGCCGQMDFTARDGVVYVAANCDFKVQKYDRAGKKLGDFGKRASGRGAAGEEAFTGCCEPKNVAFDTDGNLLVAESDACCVKRFSPDGKYLGFAGSVPDITGCVRVTMARARDGRIYMLDTDHDVIRPVQPGKAHPKRDGYME